MNEIKEYTLNFIAGVLFDIGLFFLIMVLVAKHFFTDIYKALYTCKSYIVGDNNE